MYFKDIKHRDKSILKKMIEEQILARKILSEKLRTFSKRPLTIPKFID
jgi:hypothetical protein